MSITPGQVQRALEGGGAGLRGLVESIPRRGGKKELLSVVMHLVALMPKGNLRQSTIYDVLLIAAEWSRTHVQIVTNALLHALLADASASMGVTQFDWAEVAAAMVVTVQDSVTRMFFYVRFGEAVCCWPGAMQIHQIEKAAAAFNLIYDDHKEWPMADALLAILANEFGKQAPGTARQVQLLGIYKSWQTSEALALPEAPTSNRKRVRFLGDEDDEEGRGAKRARVAF